MDVEVCVSSIEDVLIAQEAGATRIELCSTMEVIGITPTLSYFKLAKKVSKIPLMVFIRPRAGGFVYSDLEFEIMKQDIVDFYQAGARSFVFGILTKNNEIDNKRCKELMNQVGTECEFIFHKAFDYVDDFENGLKDLIDLGFIRVLTSGGIGDTLDNIKTLDTLINKYGDQIEIMPGGGITERNVKEIINTLDIKSVHLSAKTIQKDVIDYIITDKNHLKNVVDIIQSAKK